jgi:hypothetical protein
MDTVEKILSKVERLGGWDKVPDDVQKHYSHELSFVKTHGRSVCIGNLYGLERQLDEAVFEIEPPTTVDTAIRCMTDWSASRHWVEVNDGDGWFTVGEGFECMGADDTSELAWRLRKFGERLIKCAVKAALTEKDDDATK